MYHSTTSDPLPQPREGSYFLDAALWYASMNLKVIPLRPFTNVPNGSLLGRGYHLADVGSSDPNVIRTWWDIEPLSNIGIVQGAPSGTMVLDLDVKYGRDPMKPLTAWMKETGIVLERGAVARTSSGGWHYWFELPDGVDEVPSPAGWLLDVDVRADGSQVCVPPSVVELKVRVRRANGDPRPVRGSHSGIPMPVCWIDTAGNERFPTKAEFSAAIRRAPAPMELLDDIRTHRGTRGRNALIGRNLPNTVVAPSRPGDTAPSTASGGSVPIDWYLHHGVEAGQQWPEFWRIAYSLVGRKKTRQEAFVILREIADRSPLTGEPWEHGDPTDVDTTSLWAIVNRAFDRAEKLDGDAVDQAKQQGELGAYAGFLNNLGKDGIR